MNQELSRVKTYGNRRNGKKERTPGKQAAPVMDVVKPAIESVPLEVVTEQQSSVLSEEEVSASEYRSRTEIFPSRRIRVSKWFLNFLSTLFVLITAALLWWGIEGAPPLSEIIARLS